MRIRDIIAKLGGQCIGDESLDVSAVTPSEDGRPGTITFAGNRNFLSAAEASSAAAIVVPPDVSASSKTLIRTPNVLVYVADLMGLLHPEPRPPAGVHPTAVVPGSAALGLRVSVGAHVVVGERCRIGDDCIIGPGVSLADDCAVGDGSRIHANVSIYAGTTIGKERALIHSGAVLGADGFRIIPTPRGGRKMPQIGTVRIDDDVEIGANTCIDRAAFGVTHIQSGVKIDNLVQIGHNCVVGAGSILVAQCGLSGSAKLGRGAIVAGQAGIADHVTLGDRPQVGGNSGVRDDVPAGEKWLGYPAQPLADFVKEVVALRRLVKMFPALRRLVEREAAERAEGASSFLHPGREG